MNIMEQPGQASSPSEGQAARSKRLLKQYLVEALVLSFVLTLAVSFPDLKHHTLNGWEASSVFFSFGSTWLCTRQMRSNYVFGIIATVLLVVTFWQAHLYGSMALNLYLIPTVIYGWFIWGKDATTRPVAHVTFKGCLQYAVVTLVTWLGAYFLLKHFGGSMAKLDGWLLVGSVLAQWMMDRKKLENWLVWAVVNVVSVGEYWHAGLHMLSLQFALFFLNTAVAYFQWYKSMKTSEAGLLTGPLGSLATEATPVVAGQADALSSGVEQR